MNATPMLPPTARDFDIHHMSLVENVSTRQIADKHGISQTRVRQVIERVTRWIGTTLPQKSDLEREQETRLAQRLAAEQLRHQCQTLENLWFATTDPKYFRQQMRAILALARLGIVPGMIEALAADAVEGPLAEDEPQEPWSEDDPWANQGRVPSVPSPPPTGACSASGAQTGQAQPSGSG